MYYTDSMLNFLLKAIPFIFVILSEGYHIISYHVYFSSYNLYILQKHTKQKELIWNLFVTNLSDIRDFEGKILKKQLKSICLLSIR